jgi:IS605 OrfB family transposase
MIVVHRIALDPNAKQETFFRKSAGTARFAYNWALAEWRRQYEEGGKPTESNLRRLLNQIKEEAYPWMLEVSKNVIQQAINKQGPESGKKPSKNFVKAARRLARIDARTANIRADATHKATTDRCRTCAEIVLEDLSVQGMMANHKIAGAISDAAFFEFRRQIDYKAKRYACKVTIAPWFFPSSKLCSRVWTEQRKSHVEGSRLDVPRMWRRAPARSECGSKFSKSRREFTGDSLDCRIERYGDLAMRTWQWSGQLWLGTQAPNETGRCEAGTYPTHKKPRLGERRANHGIGSRGAGGRGRGA